jgi:hypothetical protein
MSPVIPEEARNAPQHAERLNGAGSFDLSHVGDLPAELIEDVAHNSLRRLSAGEHRRLAARELRIDHQRIAHRLLPLPKPFLVGWLNTFGGLHQLVGGPNALGDRQGALRRKKAVLQIERMRLESKRTGDASKKH